MVITGENIGVIFYCDKKKRTVIKINKKYEAITITNKNKSV